MHQQLREQLNLAAGFEKGQDLLIKQGNGFPPRLLLTPAPDGDNAALCVPFDIQHRLLLLNTLIRLIPL